VAAAVGSRDDVVGCLQALGGRRHGEALLALLGIAEQAMDERASS
jgi:hypothetical protein